MGDDGRGLPCGLIQLAGAAARPADPPAARRSSRSHRQVRTSLRPEGPPPPAIPSRISYWHEAYRADAGPRQLAGRNLLSGRSPLPLEGGRKGGRPPSAGRAGALVAPRGRRSPRRRQALRFGARAAPRTPRRVGRLTCPSTPPPSPSPGPRPRTRAPWSPSAPAPSSATPTSPPTTSPASPSPASTIPTRRRRRSSPPTGASPPTARPRRPPPSRAPSSTSRHPPPSTPRSCARCPTAPSP